MSREVAFEVTPQGGSPTVYTGTATATDRSSYAYLPAGSESGVARSRQRIDDGPWSPWSEYVPYAFVLSPFATVVVYDATTQALVDELSTRYGWAAMMESRFPSPLSFELSQGGSLVASGALVGGLQFSGPNVFAWGNAESVSLLETFIADSTSTIRIFSSATGASVRFPVQPSPAVTGAVIDGDFSSGMGIGLEGLILSAPLHLPIGTP